MALADVVDAITCPACGETDSALGLQGRALRCANGHGYDVARQGYVNLTGRAEPRHADTAAMVAARERFLGCGAYDPVADALLDAVREALAPAAETATLVEAGAGPAWYLARVLRGLAPVLVRGLALDVSVAASRRAARHEDVALGAAVVDVWGRLPLRTGAADVVLSVFAPRNPSEFARVLRPGGTLVVASPLPEHLVGLRSALGLLDVEPGKQQRLETTLGGSFAPVRTTDVRFRRELGASVLADLVAMGPNAFHTSPDELARRLDGRPPPYGLEVAVQVGVWRRPA